MSELWEESMLCYSNVFDDPGEHNSLDRLRLYRGSLAAIRKRHDRQHGQQAMASSRSGKMSDPASGTHSRFLGLPGEKSLRLRVCSTLWFWCLLLPS